MAADPSRTNRSAGSKRRGAAWIVMLLLLLLVAGGIGYVYYKDLDQKKPDDALLNIITKPVVLERFEHVVLEQGEIESASNQEIRCEVKARTGGSGITILEIVPEGTRVAQGDVIVRLDSRALETDRVKQQIVCNTSEAATIQATNALESAKIAKTEYLQGTFKEQEQNILAEVFVAEQNLRSAELSRNSTERLALKGIVTSLQLEGEQFAVEKARKELAAARTKLKVLREFTKAKMVNQLDSDIAIAEAKLKSEQNTNELEKKNLSDIDDQLAKCTIKAPTDGTIVYANKFSQGRMGGNAEFVVEAGAQVREQQPIIRLPDASKMQVKATVSESRIRFVTPGLPAQIRADALKDVWLEGEVVKVNQYAEPGGWGGGTVKRYAAFVRIKNPRPELRVNMNAEVRIYARQIPEALQVPVQGVVEHKQHYFCVVKQGDKYETKEVARIATNDKFFALDSGVAVGDEIVLNPRQYASILDLPDLPDPRPEVSAPSGPSPGEQADASPGGKGPPGGSPKGPGGGGFTAEGMIDRQMESADADKDGKLSTKEIDGIQFPEFVRDPDGTRSAIKAADTDADGLLDRAEMTVYYNGVIKRMERMRQQREAGGGGPAGGGFSGGGG